MFSDIRCTDATSARGLRRFPILRRRDGDVRDEGLVEIGRDVEGVEVSVFIRQKDEEETYKVSMRSNDYVNVSDVCMMFGGGGHEKAAGAVIQGDIEQVKQKIMKELEKVLK